MEQGSDCPTGKRQWATRAAAEEAVVAARRRGWASFNSYRCAWCGCWHTGNKLGTDNSKSRRQRKTARKKKSRRR